jgi:hypothetical protein
VGDDGGLEIKSPSLKVHTGYLYKGKVPAKYFPQVQMSLFVTKRSWWDFMSYHPKVEPLIVRAYPDLDWHKKLDAGLKKLVAKRNEIVKKIQG